MTVKPRNLYERNPGTSTAFPVNWDPVAPLWNVLVWFSWMRPLWYWRATRAVTPEPQGLRSTCFKGFRLALLKSVKWQGGIFSAPVKYLSFSEHTHVGGGIRGIIIFAVSEDGAIEEGQIITGWVVQLHLGENNTNRKINIRNVDNPFAYTCVPNASCHVFFPSLMCWEVRSEPQPQSHWKKL